MTFAVRLFPYKGVATAKLSQVVQQGSDSVFVLRDPYTALANNKLTSNGATEVVSAPMPTGTTLLRVEVDDGNTIRYEMRMGDNNRTASTNSPTLSGREILFASDGAVFAFCDAAATP